nr:hypothetical protein [Tanacetum cinerariifolium]
MRSWPLFARESSRGTFPVLDGFCQDRAWSFLLFPSQSTHSANIARLKKNEKRFTKQVNMFMSGSGDGGMMSQEMIRMATRMRTIVRGCGVNIDLYLADNGSFVTSSLVL